MLCLQIVFQSPMIEPDQVMTGKNRGNKISSPMGNPLRLGSATERLVRKSCNYDVRFLSGDDPIMSSRF
jgi:hypothetical protein